MRLIFSAFFSTSVLKLLLFFFVVDISYGLCLVFIGSLKSFFWIAQEIGKISIVESPIFAVEEQERKKKNETFDNMKENEKYLLSYERHLGQ